MYKSCYKPKIQFSLDIGRFTLASLTTTLEGADKLRNIPKLGLRTFRGLESYFFKK